MSSKLPSVTSVFQRFRRDGSAEASGVFDFDTVIEAANIVISAEVWILGGLALSGFIFNPNSEFRLFGVVFPYDHTVVIWAAAYIMTRRFKPVKPVYFLFLWGFQELAWNTVYLTDRLPASLSWGATQGIVQWERYTLVLVVISFLSLLLIRRHLTVSKRWLGVFLVFEMVYFASGVPIVSDRLAGTYIPSNWIWEVTYNLVAMPLYLLIFREKRSRDIDSPVSS